MIPAWCLFHSLQYKLLESQKLALFTHPVPTTVVVGTQYVTQRTNPYTIDIFIKYAFSLQKKPLNTENANKNVRKPLTVMERQCLRENNYFSDCITI